VFLYCVVLLTVIEGFTFSTLIMLIWNKEGKMASNKIPFQKKEKW